MGWYPLGYHDICAVYDAGEADPYGPSYGPESAGPEVEILTATEDFESRSDFEGEEKLRGQGPVDWFGFIGIPHILWGFLYQLGVLKTTGLQTNQLK